MKNITVNAKAGPVLYETIITNSLNTIVADERIEDGGGSKGMNPFELLLGSLGACTNITLRMYAQRKGWKIDEVNVWLKLEREETLTRIMRDIEVKGDLTDENRNRLLEIAKVCPVAKILEGQVKIESTLI